MVKTLAHGQGLIREVTLLPRGHIRIETALKYPDGTSVEVFVRKPHHSGEVHLTDLGQTLARFLDVQQAASDDVLTPAGVEREGGELTLRLAETDQLIGGTRRLAQACIRLAALSHERKRTEPASG